MTVRTCPACGREEPAPGVTISSCRPLTPETREALVDAARSIVREERGAELSDVEAIGELRELLGLYPGAGAEAVIYAVRNLAFRVHCLELVVDELRGEGAS